MIEKMRETKLFASLEKCYYEFCLQESAMPQTQNAHKYRIINQQTEVI